MKMRETVNVEHRFDNYLATDYTEQGRCRVRIFEDTEGWRPAVVVLTQIGLGIGPSITTAIEYLCAEIASKFWFGQRDDTVWIEYYPARASMPESFQRVRFGPPYPHPGVREAGGRLQVGFGVPRWETVDRAEVERMMGGSLSATVGPGVAKRR